MKEVIFVIITTIFLNGCYQVVALVGPMATGATGGNVTHSALSYGLSYGVKRATGKTPIEQVISVTKEKRAKAKKNDLLRKLLSQHFEKVAPVF